METLKVSVGPTNYLPLKVTFNDGQQVAINLFKRPSNELLVSVHGNDTTEEISLRLTAPMDKVAVAFEAFNSPSEAAAYTGQSFTYEAPASMKLTIGDRVIVPVRTASLRTATVVKLNANCPVNYIRQVKSRV